MSSMSDKTFIANKSVSDHTKGDIPFKKTAFDWHLFDKRADVLRDLREKQEFVDLMLETEDGGQELVHFAIVSALGKQFTQCIADVINTSDAIDFTLDNGFVVKKVLLKNVDKNILKIIVDCSYNGFIATNSDTIWPLIRTAEHYLLEEVLDSSLTYLIRELNVQNCVQVFHLGLKHRHKLTNASYAFIRTMFAQVVDKCSDFPKLTFKQLLALIVEDELNVQNERQVFNAIIRWTTEDMADKRDKLPILLSRLRFARIDSTFIANIAKQAIICEDRDCQTVVRQFKDKYNSFTNKKDGNGLYVGLTPEPIRPRVPHQIILAFGGWQEGVTSTLMETYDNRTNQWFNLKLSHDFPRAYHGLEVINGLVYVIGGTNGTDILNTVQCFNPITKKWYTRSSMSESRCYVSTGIVDGTIYAMGGHNGRQRVKTCETYDASTDKWTTIRDMNMSRSDASAAVRHRMIYIAGGLNDQLIENTIEFYNPDDRTWTFIQPMSTPRTSLGLVCLHDCLYAIGGNNGIERLKSAEKYDFKLRSWLPVTDMKTKRSTFATAIIEGQLHVIGGYNGQTPISSVERYDEKTNNWLEVKALKHDRSGLGVCVLTGLSNAVDYTYIGVLTKRDQKKRRQTEGEIIGEDMETSDEEMEIDL